MIHGSYGYLNSNLLYMIDRKCSKHYHWEFIATTITNKFGYPLYRRRYNKQIIKKRKITIDNRWIIPYNLYLYQKYNCHINIEICSSICLVKYLYKYVYKGHDHIIATIKGQYDEITKYLNTRYISTSEAY